jgi:hypothetical protein
VAIPEEITSLLVQRIINNHAILTKMKGSLKRSAFFTLYEGLQKQLMEYIIKNASGVYNEERNSISG